jgi:hypothetical protein
MSLIRWVTSLSNCLFTSSATFAEYRGYQKRRDAPTNRLLRTRNLPQLASGLFPGDLPQSCPKNPADKLLRIAVGRIAFVIEKDHFYCQRPQWTLVGKFTKRLCVAGPGEIVNALDKPLTHGPTIASSR